jgi:hypothetical protein
MSIFHAFKLSLNISFIDLKDTSFNHFDILRFELMSKRHDLNQDFAADAKFNCRHDQVYLNAFQITSNVVEHETKGISEMRTCPPRQSLLRNRIVWIPLSAQCFYTHCRWQYFIDALELAAFLSAKFVQDGSNYVR